MSAAPPPDPISDAAGAVAPLFLAIYVLVDGAVPTTRGREHFVHQVDEDLKAQGLQDPIDIAEDFWNYAGEAAEPSTFGGRLMAISLGFYLLLPRELAARRVSVLVLAMALLLAPQIARFIPIGSKFRRGDREVSVFKLITTVLLVAQAAAAVVKIAL